MTRILRDALLHPDRVRVMDAIDQPLRHLDGLLDLRASGRAALRLDDGHVIVLTPGSGRYGDRDAGRIAHEYLHPEARARPLAELAAEAEARAAVTVHERVPCLVCGAQVGELCVHREYGEPDEAMDGYHEKRIEADR